MIADTGARWMIQHPSKGKGGGIMQLKLERVSTLSIDSKSGWQITAAWLLWPENVPVAEDELNAWHAEVESWLPRPGDPWRRPAENSPGYLADDGWRVSEVRSEEAGDNAFRIAVTGRPRRWNAEPAGRMAEVFTASGERTRSAVWRVDADGLGNWLPGVGDALEWDGGAFRCTGIQLKETGDSGWEVTIEAVDLGIEPVAAIAFRRNCDYESVKTGKWRVAESELEAFAAANEVNSPAAWAGEGYFVISYAASASGAGLYEVTVEARHVNVRLVEVLREEKFIGFNRQGRARRRVVWTSRWRVRRDSLRSFENVAGASAYSWTGGNSVVTSSAPRRISDLEYEYTLQAIPRNGNMYEVIDDDDRSDLAGRVDVVVNVADFMLAAEHCGWRRLSDGSLYAIPDWDPSSSCPLNASATLPGNLIDAVLKTVQAVETRYYRMHSYNLVAQVQSWMSTSRVWSGKVGSHTGQWLKEDVTTEVVIDDAGEAWQKVAAVFRLPPAGYQWNSNYWV